MNNAILLRSLQTGYRLDYNKDDKTFQAVKEKRAGCCRCFKGESAKQAEALDQAIHELKTMISTGQPLETSELINLDARLSKRIQVIRSRTKGLIGWIRALIRGRKETRALKKVSEKLSEMRLVISRVDGVAAALVTNKLKESRLEKKQWQAIQDEFPYLILPSSAARMGVTNQHFGVSKEHPHSNVPFLLTKDSSGRTLVYFPPIDPNHAYTKLSKPQRIVLHDLQSLPEEYELYKQKRRDHLFSLIDREVTHLICNRSYDNVLDNTHIPEKSPSINDQTVTITFLNFEKNRKETENFLIDEMKSPQEVITQFKELINRKREISSKIQKFLKDTFTKQVLSQGFSYSLNNKKLSFKPPENQFLNTEIYVDGLSQESYDKIKKLRSTLISNIEKLEKITNKTNVIKIKNSEIKVTWDIERQCFVFTDYHTNYLYTTCSYKKDISKTIEDLHEIVPIIKEFRLSLDALKEMSPFSEEVKIEKLPDVSASTLNTLKQRIDFSGHDLNTANDGGSISQESILSGIEKIVTTIEKYHKGEDFTYYGIPKDKVERQKYFDDLEARLTHLIRALEQPEHQAMLSDVLINLGVGGNHCGGRWKDEVYNYYSLFCRPLINEASAALDQWLQLQIDQQKQEAVEKMVAQGNGKNTAHVRMRYLKSLANHNISVPGSASAMYEDEYSNFGGGVSGIDIPPLFFQTFDLFGFIRECKELINTRLEKIEGNKHEKEICRHFGSQVNNFLQSAVREFMLPHMPEEQKEYEQICNTCGNKGYLKNAYLDDIINNLGLTIVDKDSLITKGVTHRGMAVLLYQTGKMTFKHEGQNLVTFIQGLSKRRLES